MPRKRRPRRLINRYAQSRLYDVETRTYVSVERLREWRGKGFEIVIREVETGRFVSDEVLPTGFDALNLILTRSASGPTGRQAACPCR